MNKLLKSLALSGMMLLMSFPAVAATNTLTMTSSTPITAGAELKNYTWDIEDGMVKAAVIELDLTNPYVQLTIIPGEGKFTQRTTVSKMASRTGALAAVNGDFYNTKAEGAPIGTTVIDGELVSSQSYLNGVYCMGITADRTAYIDQFGFSGSVTSALGKQYQLAGLNKTVYWEETTGAHSHIGKLHLYNDLWGGTTRGMDTYVGTPAEVLIKDNRVMAVAFEGGFDYAVPEGCYILHGDGEAAEHLKNNYKVGDQITINYSVTPDKDWSMVVGGHALLVDQGQLVEYTKDLSALKGIRARTAAGISQDGKKVYLIAVEGRTSESKGITLGNLSLLMTKIGVWKGVNLDGGGSTTIVSRPLGETEATTVLAVEGHAAQRRVVEALGVFSTAPQGTINGLTIAGNQQLLVGEMETYTFKAYDQYYNTVTDTSGITLSESNSLGLITGHTFLARQAGTTEITAAGGTAAAKLEVKVIGKDDLSKLELALDNHKFADGSTHQITVKATLKDGTEKTVGTNALEWTVEGFDGTIDNNGLLTVGQLGDAQKGVLTATYDGFTASLNLNLVPAASIQLQIDHKTLMKDGQALEMDVAPLIKDSRTLVPLRFVSEALGGEVIWVDEDGVQIAMVIYNGTLLELPINEQVMYINSESVAIDVPSQIVNERTMVPLRAIIEGLGMKVTYEDATRSITIEG